MAEHFNYFDIDFKDELTCPACGRVATVHDLFEPYRELFDCVCPGGHMIAIVAYPTVEETKKAAAAGNPKAIESLDGVRDMEDRWARAKEFELASPSQLPEIDGEQIELEWDFDDGGEKWTVIRYGDRVVWRELAYWEGIERFYEVKAILKQRYGRRFRSLTPTEGSLLYLLGDRLTTVNPN